MGMRYRGTAKNVDANQPIIVAALRGVGATVQHLQDVGGGCPDLLVGYQGKNYLVEVKDGAKKLSAQKLNEIQVGWHEQWKGQVCVVKSVEEAMSLLGINWSPTDDA